METKKKDLENLWFDEEAIFNSLLLMSKKEVEEVKAQLRAVQRKIDKILKEEENSLLWLEEILKKENKEG